MEGVCDVIILIIIIFFFLRIFPKTQAQTHHTNVWQHVGCLLFCILNDEVIFETVVLKETPRRFFTLDKTLLIYLKYFECFNSMADVYYSVY